MKVLQVIFRLLMAPVYFVAVSGFFIFSALADSFKKAKPLTLSQNEKALDGVSFVIPTWNKKDLLLRCLELLDERLSKEGKKLKKEIIVIENGSSDGSLEALQKLKTKTKLVILASPTNLGFSKGINWGVREAKYNYVYLLNNDMEVQPGFFDTVITTAQDILKTSSGFFGIASQIFFYDPTKRREESGKTYCSLNLGFLNVAHYVEPAALTESSLTLYPGGGSALINRKLFLSLGGYDHAAYVPLYCEDLDAGVVAWKLGWPSYFEPRSQVIHHHQSSSKSLARPPEFFMHKNWLVVILKNLDGFKEIFQHILLFSARILLSNETCEYALAALKNLPNLYTRKRAMAQFTTRFSGSEILNFQSFELTHDQT